MTTCQLDSDGDGIPDNEDLCPGTPEGELVDNNGCTPVQATQSVYDELQDVVDSNLGTPLADKVEDALAKIQTALDELNKTPLDNQAAMGAIEGAVGDLEAALDDDLCNDDANPPQREQLLNDSMDDLAGTARQLAVEASDEAIACDPDNPDIAVAQQALDDGDALRELALGPPFDPIKFKEAVNEYKDALAKAEGVLSSCP